jgi:hypothetical protein
LFFDDFSGWLGFAALLAAHLGMAAALGALIRRARVCPDSWLHLAMFGLAAGLFIPLSLGLPWAFWPRKLHLGVVYAALLWAARRPAWPEARRGAYRYLAAASGLALAWCLDGQSPPGSRLLAPWAALLILLAWRRWSKISRDPAAAARPVERLAALALQDAQGERGAV